MSRIDVELLLVVWVDEPQSALADSVACSGRQTLETFDGYTRGSYAHQFANVACRGSAYLQQAFVECLWQQMNEWKFRGNTNTNLLMTAERVLPSRETKESDATLFEK